MNQRFSRGCDIFTLCGHLHVSFAHLIAQNIDIPSVFLEYPTKEDFLSEIEKGYDYVAISAFHNQMDDLVEMCHAVRQKAPDSEIVLGGWGAVGLDVTSEKDELKTLCDHLCREEGIRFFRRLLGEDPDRPAFHCHLPKWGYSLPMITRYPAGDTPVAVGSLGCPNACDFCATAEMFDNKRVQIMSPEQVHKEFRRAWRENPNAPQATLLEEDSFQNKDYIMELGRLLREDPEFGLSYYNFYCLASIQSMSQFSFEEMMLTGCTTVFVGVESKFASSEGYDKTQGLSAEEMFKGLHNVGIFTTGAWMIGFDFQDRQNIKEDLQHFISLEPSMQQLTRVCPFPGTPMWYQMKEENRIREDVSWEEISFYGGGGMTPKNFNDHEVMAIIEQGYKQLYETHGASLARICHVNMLGYQYGMENRHRNKYLGDRAIMHKRMAYTIYPILKSMEIYAPNNIVRKRMKELRRMYARVCGEPTSFQKILERLFIGRAGIEKLLDVAYPRDNILKEEPSRKYIYNKPAPLYPECPYEVVYLHKSLSFDLNQFANTIQIGLARMLIGACRLLDERKGMVFDEAARRGPFLSFF